jgi:phospholipid/cholesterol/gamma-HCH transport system substrate-binding protein
MHLQTRVKVQLAIFLVIAITATVELAIGYAHAPALLFGIGRYNVTIQLPEAGGLYDRANVTYRGTTVGRVRNLRVTHTGVQAELSLQSGIAIPSDLDAQVHSQSPVGEQYVALVPRDDTSSPLRDGDVIAADRTSVPPDIGDSLDKTNASLLALPNDDAKTLIDESYAAFGGLGAELSRVIDSATNLATDAKDNLADLTNVIDNSGPLLASQIYTADAVSAWSAHLATVTSELQKHNDAVSGLLRNGGPAADEARALLDRLRPTLPVVLANLVSIDQVGIVYQADLEQTLVLFPQNLSQVAATKIPSMNTKQFLKGAQENFATNLNLPPPCLTGYLPASQRRSPALVDSPPRPEGDFYCRVPQDSPIAVRGARNIPCETKPWKRAPTVWMCESDENYVPLNDGNNWKGDPNATFTGQGVPQLPPDQRSVPSPDGTPPLSTPPAALGIADYNAANGTYVGPDGAIYTQSDLAKNAPPPTLRSMLFPPAVP